jgi:hypothetical protein
VSKWSNAHVFVPATRRPGKSQLYEVFDIIIIENRALNVLRISLLFTPLEEVTCVLLNTLNLVPVNQKPGMRSCFRSRDMHKFAVPIPSMVAESPPSQEVL